MAERHKLAQVKAFLIVMADKTHPLHGKFGQRPLSRLKIMKEATGTIENSLSVEIYQIGAPWIVTDDCQKHYTKFIATLGRELQRMC